MLLVRKQTKLLMFSNTNSKVIRVHLSLQNILGNIHVMVVEQKTPTDRPKKEKLQTPAKGRA